MQDDDPSLLPAREGGAPAPEEGGCPPLPDYSAEIEAENAFGAFQYSAEEGIRHMTARIAGLEREIADALANEFTGTDVEYLAGLRARIAPQLNDAKLRLAHYELLLKSKN